MNLDDEMSGGIIKKYQGGADTFQDSTFKHRDHPDEIDEFGSDSQTLEKRGTSHSPNRSKRNIHNHPQKIKSVSKRNGTEHNSRYANETSKQFDERYSKRLTTSIQTKILNEKHIRGNLTQDLHVRSQNQSPFSAQDQRNHFSKDTKRNSTSEAGRLSQSPS